MTPRLSPSDTLFLVLTVALLLVTAFTLGALAAHPFDGGPGTPPHASPRLTAPAAPGPAPRHLPRA